MHYINSTLMIKNLVIFLKWLISFVAGFAIFSMVITDDYKYCVFPIAILLINIYEGIKAAINSDDVYTKHPYQPNYGYSYNDYHTQYSAYSTTYYPRHQQHLQDSADVEKDAIKKIKRGLKVTIDKSNS